MTTAGWIIAIALIAYAFKIHHIFVGLLTPKLTLGKNYLKQQLKEIGVDPGLFPEALLETLVRDNLATAKFNSQNTGTLLLEEYTKRLKFAAQALKAYLVAPEQFEKMSEESGDDYYMPLLSRYAVPRAIMVNNITGETIFPDV